uniref:Uncharacterized protein n=1 Tax=Anolis carolinensis TaxID=28377 RepID=A0A803TV90_ANOCA
MAGEKLAGRPADSGSAPPTSPRLPWGNFSSGSDCASSLGHSAQACGLKPCPLLLNPLLAVAFQRWTKSHPLFSQEFLIHNHANIGFCLVLCILISLMFEVSGSPLPLLRSQVSLNNSPSVCLPTMPYLMHRGRMI